MIHNQILCPNCKGIMQKNGLYSYCLNCGKRIINEKKDDDENSKSGVSFWEFFDHVDGEDEELDDLYDLYDD